MAENRVAHQTIGASKKPTLKLKSESPTRLSAQTTLDDLFTEPVFKTDTLTALKELKAACIEYDNSIRKSLKHYTDQIAATVIEKQREPPTASQANLTVATIKKQREPQAALQTAVQNSPQTTHFHSQLTYDKHDKRFKSRNKVLKHVLSDICGGSKQKR